MDAVFSKDFSPGFCLFSPLQEPASGEGLGVGSPYIQHPPHTVVLSRYSCRGNKMSRNHYSSADRQRALSQLAANGNDVILTAAQLNIPARTLYRWRWRANKPLPLSSPPSSEGAAPSSAMPKLSEDDTQALRTLKRIMLENAYQLAGEIQPAIPHSTLPERVIALVRLVDRIYKLAFQLPDSPDEEVEYEIVGAETFERGRGGAAPH